MKLACVSSDKPGKIDLVLSGVASRLEAAGLTLAGIVKDLNHPSRFQNGCDMHVRVLPDGPVIQITQDLGSGSAACRLDPGAIAKAVSIVERQSLDGADLFILNKFGPEEAAGRGFVSAIGGAIELEVPVLVGVGAKSRGSFDSFADGLAEDLPADLHIVLDWCQAALRTRVMRHQAFQDAGH